ncbi:MAG: hypothetical protein FWH19_04725 [Treponema sp.]|nr:hypothetical protein [Treponema sp.]
MRKPVLPRILLFSLLYCAFFVALVTIQFSKRGGFTHRVGSLVVSGQYRLPDVNDRPNGPNEYYLDGEVNIIFGGMDFGIIRRGDGNSFHLVRRDGTRDELLPERMLISGNSVIFEFPGAAELTFSTQHSGGALEMRITADFMEDVTSIELPFRPLRRTGIRDTGDGQLTVNAGGQSYSFGRSPIDMERRLLLVRAEGISYRVIPTRRDFSPGDFILPEAQSAEAFNEFTSRWRDHSYALWNRSISEQNNEDMVVAFAAEALNRGNYRAAVAAVPQTFLRGAYRTHDSSVYIGGLDQAYRSLIARDREKLARISRQINERSLDFLLESRVIEYLAIRGNYSIIDAGAELVRTTDPSMLSLDIVPGILEGFMDWKTFRPLVNNPFEHLVDQACFVASDSLRLSPDASRIFSLDGSSDTAEFNVRLGRALLDYAEDAQNASWTGIARSLIISALSIEDTRSGLNSASLYRILRPVNTYPRAVTIARGTNNNIWAWTAAQIVNVSQNADMLDITVSFPAGETHYMIVRGIQPFPRMQLYNIDFPSDPQFEIYDSSGWVYIPQEQCLIVKMRHRSTVENIRILYTESEDEDEGDGE